MVDEESLLKLVRAQTFQQLTTEEIARELGAGPKDNDEMTALLDDMERRGQLVCMKEKHWLNPDQAGLVVGRLQCNPRGFAFLLPVREGIQDVYVAAEGMGEAMHGDLVVVELQRRTPPRGKGSPGKDRGPAGRIIKVIERRNDFVT